MGFIITADEIIAFLASKGYSLETRRGRHGVKMVKGKHKISIVTHGSRDIPKGTANSILAQAGYTADDVMNWRKN
jgi:predicted RNA binding protein YcfA (HicA-like mRNA interferase family)